MYAKEQLESIDYLKWKIDLAEGFQIINNEVITLGWQSKLSTIIEGNDYWDGLFHVHLLTRAVEGFNQEWVKGHKIGTIKQFSTNIVVSLTMLGLSRAFNFEDYGGSEDLAKDQALYYVYEKEYLNE